ncbi:MAG TPA: 3-oxoacyl-[acyl-carrier-protein] synthase III C-terminal domain-containing protein [Candidatus Saccharimonadales bacterium]|nr:3-oxoacyl-[acyl-carrier-protein] synthase III C-terminal domain-containing protein [Candidatus Saccharimonadales bacterium]
MNIDIIGWGDTPTNPKFAVFNDEVIDRVLKRQANLILRAHHEKKLDEVAKWEAELEKMRKLTPEAITEKIGVVCRQYCWGKTSYQLAVEAAKRAIEKAYQNDPDFHVWKIAAVYFGSSSADNAYPGGHAYAHYCQEALNLGRVEGITIADACCSATAVMAMAHRTMSWRPERYPYILALFGEVVGSTHNAFEDENATLWGDGGAALILRANPRGDPACGIIDSYGRVDGTSNRPDGKNPKYLATLSEGNGAALIHRWLRLNNSMCGKEKQIFRAVVGEIPDDILENFIYPNNYLELLRSERSELYPHNGNEHMLESNGAKLGISPERIRHRVRDRANQSSVSSVSSFAYHADLGLVTSGKAVWFETFASGLEWWMLLNVIP